MGCQSRYPYIYLSNYKAEGYGFQYDAICSDVYTYSFYFRNQAPHNISVNMNISPLHARVNDLLQQLPLSNYKCAMGNLYISANLCRYVYYYYYYFFVINYNSYIPFYWLYIDQPVVQKKKGWFMV